MGCKRFPRKTGIEVEARFNFYSLSKRGKEIDTKRRFDLE
jgi:hypothetical protein